MKSNKIKSSIVIPNKNRTLEVDRAILSILKCNGADDVEIIVVDDFSDDIFASSLLRPHDHVIRLNKPSGAAVARNLGIKKSTGTIIYLLDSDDYIINRDFESDYHKYKDFICLFYCSIESGGYKSQFPDEVSDKDFFDYIFYKYPFICQTSSLFFNRSVGLLFDESLPKHQDWDFVFFSALCRGVSVKKADGLIYFDRSDRLSLSRTLSPEKSDVWAKKLRNHFLNSELIQNEITEFYLYGRYASRYSWSRFFFNSAKFIIKRKLRSRTLLVMLYYRFKEVSNFIIK